MAVATRADHATTGGALRDLWRRVAATTGARMYSLAAGAVGLIVSARVLGTEGRGFVATAVTWSMLFATVGYLSLGQVALHRATGRPPEEWLGPTLGVLLAMATVVTLIGWVAAGGLYLATGGAAYGHVPGYVLVLGFATLPF